MDFGFLARVGFFRQTTEMETMNTQADEKQTIQKKIGYIETNRLFSNQFNIALPY